MDRTKIVVLTPVRNEEWILRRFLSVTSAFADVIIVSDQKSTDRSREICRSYSKVVLIENPSDEFNEAERQQMLLNKARSLVTGRKLLLALDSDEILAADALQMKEWDQLFTAPPGTVLLFEKIDLYKSTGRCLRWHDNPYPLGFVDDGSKHETQKIHSIRIPMPAGAPRMIFRDVKFLHYAFANERLQEAKLRYYSVVENTLGTSSGLQRRVRYPRAWFAKFEKQAVPTSETWFKGWERSGIEMHDITQSVFSWHDFEVLRKCSESGSRRFFWDDIWTFDWEACRQFAATNGLPSIPTKALLRPSWLDQAARTFTASFYEKLRIPYAWLKRKLR